MPHYLQQIRAQNMDLIKKVIAQTMPKGSKDKELRASLQRRFGFTGKAVNNYLTVLSDAGELEQKNGIWKLV